MKAFHLLRRTSLTAPNSYGIVDLEDYEEIGVLVASSRSEAVRKWCNRTEDMFGEPISPPVRGDILQVEDSQWFILTPENLWASCTVIE